MEVTDEIQNKIDKYLFRQLDKREHEAFEQALHEDFEFKREVELQKKVFQALSLLGDKQLKDELDIIHEKVASRKNKNLNLYSVKTLGIAASLLALVGVFVFFMLKNNPNPDHLFAQYYTPEKYTVVRGDESTDNKGGDYFNEGNYTKAIEALTESLAKNPTSYYDQLFIGLSYLESGNFSKAEENLFEVARSSKTLKQKAEWYLALTYLKEGKVVEAKRLLNSLANDSTDALYKENAGKLLSEMD